MRAMASVKAHRVAMRRHRDGSGPAVAGAPVARFPGAAGAFALLGEVGLTGLLIVAVALPVVTLPIALAAGIRHLRRYVRAEDSRLRFFWADVRAGLLPGAAVGSMAAIIVAVLLVDIDVAASGALPGGIPIAAVGWAGVAAAAVAVLTASGLWDPAVGWRRALRAVPRAVAADPAGALYLLAAAAFVVILTWALIPLLVPAIGCAAFAAVAVPERPQRRRA